MDKEKNPMTSSGKYLYGIIKEPSPKRFDISGIEDNAVYTVNWKNLAVVVSDSSNGEVDPTRKNVRAHAMVQEKLLSEYTLLPMGFGMVASSDEEALRLLEENYDALLREIEYLRGKIEVALKVYWNQEAVRKELEEKSKDLSKLKAKIESSTSVVEAQSLLVEAGMLVEGLIEKWKDKCVDKIYDSLKRLAVGSKLSDPMGIKNILNASFLLERPREEAFKQEVYRLDSEFEGRLDFKYIAPLPPYNFVGITLELP